MKSIKYSFPLDPEALRARDMLATRLLETSEVRSFMEKYSCPESIVIEHASMFGRWLDRVKQSRDITLDMIRDDESKGHFLDLRYDDATGILEEYFVTLPQLEALKKQRSYLSRYKIMPLSKSLHNASFETLNFKGESQSYEALASLMMRFTLSDETGYYLYGDLGVGKTYLAACVSNYFAKHDHDVAFIHVPTFLNLIKESFNNDELRVDLSRLKKVKLLVLDDLGAEPITPWSRDEILLMLLNERYENKMKTIITSNITPDKLVQLYKVDARGSEDLIRSRRLVDRILSLTKPVEMIGDNRRYGHKKAIK